MFENGVNQRRYAAINEDVQKDIVRESLKIAFDARQRITAAMFGVKWKCVELLGVPLGDGVVSLTVRIDGVDAKKKVIYTGHAPLIVPEMNVRPIIDT
jgi:hypothetical protein